MPVLQLEKACFSYGYAVVFEDISFNVEQGHTLCILGPNGCGKTTLVDAILGIHPVTSGRVLLNGSNIRRMAPRDSARFMAYVPQKHTRHFAFSVLDVLLMGRTPYVSFFDAPGPEDRKMAEAMLASFDLQHLKDRDYTRLSGGETQLVMIMRALLQDTPIIVMDEPTAHLDFKHELAVLEVIVRMVKEQGRTLVMATHFPNHAFYLENEAVPVSTAFMHQRRLYLTGSPTQALTPENLERYYGVNSIVVSQDLPDGKAVKQIIPIHTLKSAD